MSEIKNGGLGQYGNGPFEQQQFGTAGIERVNDVDKISPIFSTSIEASDNPSLLNIQASGEFSHKLSSRLPSRSARSVVTRPITA